MKLIDARFIMFTLHGVIMKDFLRWIKHKEPSNEWLMQIIRRNILKSIDVYNIDKWDFSDTHMTIAYVVAGVLFVLLCCCCCACIFFFFLFLRRRREAQQREIQNTVNIMCERSLMGKFILFILV